MSGETKRLNPKASTLNPGRSRALNVLWHVKCSRKTLNPGRKHAPEEVEEEFIDYQQVKTHMTCQEGLGCALKREKQEFIDNQQVTGMGGGGEWRPSLHIPSPFGV